MKRLTSDYVVNECVRYILENPIEEELTYVTLPNGMYVIIYKSDRYLSDLAYAKMHLCGIDVSARIKAEEFGFGKYLLYFFDGYSTRKILLDKYPQHTFRVYIKNNKK